MTLTINSRVPRPLISPTLYLDTMALVQQNTPLAIFLIIAILALPSTCCIKVPLPGHVAAFVPPVVTTNYHALDVLNTRTCTPITSAANHPPVIVGFNTSVRNNRRYAIDKKKNNSKEQGIGGTPQVVGIGASAGKNRAAGDKKVSTSNGSSNTGKDKNQFPPISTLLLAFLNPLRNPNSLFLYMIIIVTVLGKMNEDAH